MKRKGGASIKEENKDIERAGKRINVELENGKNMFGFYRFTLYIA